MQIAASLRASDSDREQVDGRLRHAMAEGRLSGDELAQRLEALYTAQTYGELEALLADLPVNRSLGQPHVRLARLVGAVSAVALVVAVLGVLAVVRDRASVGVLAGHLRHLDLPGPLAGPDHGLIIAAPLVAVVVVLAAAALLWALMGSRSPRQP